MNIVEFHLKFDIEQSLDLDRDVHDCLLLKAATASRNIP